MAARPAVRLVSCSPKTIKLQTWPDPYQNYRWQAPTAVIRDMERQKGGKKEEMWKETWRQWEDISHKPFFSSLVGLPIWMNYLPLFYLTHCLNVCLSVCLTYCLSVCLSARLTSWCFEPGSVVPTQTTFTAAITQSNNTKTTKSCRQCMQTDWFPVGYILHTLPHYSTSVTREPSRQHRDVIAGFILAYNGHLHNSTDRFPQNSLIQ